MEEQIKQEARAAGADDVGIASVDRLGGKPSMDTSYLLPGARSVVSVMVALDPDIVERYLSREDREAMQDHETERYRRLHAIAQRVAGVLTAQGHRTAVTDPNLDYRYKNKPGYKRVPPPVRQGITDLLASDRLAWLSPLKRALVKRVPASLLSGGSFKLTPTFSHRYGAVAAGIGAMGWSGNVLHPEHGARVLYHSVITNAELDQDPMLDETTCDRCKLCTQVCQGGFMDKKNEDGVEIGGVRHVHNQKASNLRCIFVCGGMTGQSRHERWSTWSPGRIKLPDSDDELPGLWEQVARASLGSSNHYSRTLAALQYHVDHGFVRKTKERFPTTCGNCQMVCAPDRKERKRLYKTIIEAGCVPGEPPPPGL